MDLDSLTIEDLINAENRFIDESYVNAYYAERLQIIGIVWDGFVTTEQYIDLFKRLIAFGKEHKVIGFYSDIRKQGVISIEGRKFFEKEVTPQAVALGILKTGAVSDASPFKKYYLNTIIKMTGRPAKICSEPIDALKYLLS